ncbi:LytR/AlgR family response regulator transcription factor [Chondrinema litorale]|uniref:LytR/AlgR family response regulator transcription factor n=1 Tax=Chondrinema litorale TaxID=2994555 RepID=UPI002542F2EB|nr:LytTR family DNA-binding domain-containing protein [Chondrinema litorale]UZR96411.1 LytTR family DNA-binding domain-containing protein [Chondrinema litorale]
MITAVAIDDEPKAIEVIQHHISKINGVILLASFYNAKEALNFLKQNPVDVIFLDINMPHFSGIEMLDELQRKPNVIFTTAYSDYAVESYNYNAIDYLLKPFEFERFQIAIDKIAHRIEEATQQNQFIFIKDGFKNIKITFEKVLFIKGSGNYLDIFTNEKSYSPRMTFSELIEKLPTAQFIRIHQSYIVNIEHIQKIENNQVYIANHQLPISNRYKATFFKRLNL